MQDDGGAQVGALSTMCIYLYSLYWVIVSLHKAELLFKKLQLALHTLSISKNKLHQTSSHAPWLAVIECIFGTAEYELCRIGAWLFSSFFPQTNQYTST